MSYFVSNNYQVMKLRMVCPLLSTKSESLLWNFNILRKQHNEPCRNKKKICKIPILTTDTMQEEISKLGNGDRGNIMEQAKQIMKNIAKGEKTSFCSVIEADNDDMHAAGTTPITFLRQVLVLCMYPSLLEDSRFSEDAKCRAKCILSSIKGSSLGTCPHHLGLPLIREQIAEFISKRDSGVKSDPNNLILHNSTHDAIKNTLKLFARTIEGKPTGVLLPIPHPPIYSALLSELGLYELGYQLNEKKNWTFNKKQLEKSIAEAQCHSVPRVIVAVNPGNPTGQVFSRQNVTEIIKFAHKEKLFILADEIYQENVYSETSEFYSFKKVKHELGPPFDKMELASFISASKGIYGECGLSGCCVEFDEIDECVREQIKRSQSNLLGPNMVSQVVLSCMAQPPTEENDSFELYLREKCCILTGLMQKAKLVSDRLNAIPGITIVPIEGGLSGYGKAN